MLLYVDNKPSNQATPKFTTLFKIHWDTFLTHINGDNVGMVVAKQQADKVACMVQAGHSLCRLAAGVVEGSHVYLQNKACKIHRRYVQQGGEAKQEI